MDQNNTSWNSFSEREAEGYLKTSGHAATTSKNLLTYYLKKEAKDKKISIIDLGCGNGQLYETWKEAGLNFTYTGVDFSEPLLAVARKNYLEAIFISDDVNTLERITDKYDVAVYSHVLEVLSSPETSLIRAKEIANKVFIRFFEPPEFKTDSVELKMMNVSSLLPHAPYLRRKMSKDYYRSLWQKAGFEKLETFKDESSKDQIHILQ